MRLRDEWHQVDAESLHLSIRVIGELMQKDLGVETVEQLDWLARGLGLNPASALDDAGWHLLILAAAWAKHRHPKAGKEAWQSFGSMISELAYGTIWGLSTSDQWMEKEEKARGMVSGDQTGISEEVLDKLAAYYFGR